MAGWLIPRIGMMSSLLIGTVAGSGSHVALALLRRMAGMVARRCGPSAGSRRRGLCLRLCVDRADHLHVDDFVSGARGEPVRPVDLALRLSGQHSGGFSGFVIEHTGFVWFFVWTSLIGIPVALLAVFVWYRVGISDEAPICGPAERIKWISRRWIGDPDETPLIDMSSC